MPDSSVPVISKSGEAPENLSTPPVNNGILPDALFEDRAVICIALRMEGYTYKEIQEKTSLTETQVRYALRRARAAGRLRDVLDLVDNEAVPQAVENLITVLRDPKHEKFWDATEKTLDGRGVFRRFNNNKVEGGGVGNQLPALQINILTRDGKEMPTVIVNSEKGSVFGSPREDAE